MSLALSDLLKRMLEMSGSDLHLTTNSPPQIRVHGHLVPLDLPQMTPAETKQLAYSVMTDSQKHRFEENLELDFSFGLKGLARFRANVFNQRGATSAVFRLIPFEIKSFQPVGLPAVVSKMCDKPRGLVLVTGPTGSGKSTTLAAMIDKINTERHDHILTIEDPIEFVHMNKNCVVNQREVHADTKSFTDALRAALREDPDVVLIGEMRDLETIESALRIAETGHLTFGTLHTNSASSTINRIIDVFPAHQQSADSGAVVAGAGRHHVPKLAAQRRRQGPGHGYGNPGTERRGSQPDSRRQDPPDLFVHAVGSGQVRYADIQSGAGDGFTSRSRSLWKSLWLAPATWTSCRR
jgi:twitching motility protein PilT